MRKEYENLRIVSIDGSTIVKHMSPSNYTIPLCTVKNGKLDRNKFGGIIDKSLDTEKLEEVYENHKDELEFPFVESDNFTRALVNVSFAYVIREYERYSQRYVKWGCVVTDEDMQDGICVRDGVLVAIEVPHNKDNSYATVENVLWDGEALMDVSVFEENGYGDKAVMLLRNRFFKTCAFNTNLQKWFEDNGITEVRQFADV